MRKNRIKSLLLSLLAITIIGYGVVRVTEAVMSGRNMEATIYAFLALNTAYLLGRKALKRAKASESL